LQHIIKVACKTESAFLYINHDTVVNCMFWYMSSSLYFYLFLRCHVSYRIEQQGSF